ncbi:MAG: ATP-dependent zinc protease [Porticoccaceae bacterium]|jgi:hypothetical protein
MIAIYKYRARQLLPISLLLSSALLSGCSFLSPQQGRDNSCPAAEIVDFPARVPAEPPQCPEPRVIEKLVTKIVTPELPPMATTAGKLHLPIVGAVEMVRIEPADLMLEARIDTGAETTSIHAEDIQLVENDGRRYVRFMLIDGANGEQVQQELRLRRRVLIKQSYGPDERRYVVRMWLTLGDTRSRVDVNLSDRTNFEYPLLIGRNFLTDSLIVDVSRHHALSN